MKNTLIKAIKLQGNGHILRPDYKWRKIPFEIFFVEKLFIATSRKTLEDAFNACDIEAVKTHLYSLPVEDRAQYLKEVIKCLEPFTDGTLFDRKSGVFMATYQKYQGQFDFKYRGKVKQKSQFEDTITDVRDYQILRRAYNTYKGLLAVEKIGTLVNNNSGELKQGYSTKEYALTYIFDCNAKGESLPIGQKSRLEGEGKKRMKGKSGNTFYKQFNEIVNSDLNSKQNLRNIAGDNWRNILLALSQTPTLLDKYLIDKGL